LKSKLRKKPSRQQADLSVPAKHGQIFMIPHDISYEIEIFMSTTVRTANLTQ
jgi:hypothetical protein